MRRLNKQPPHCYTNFLRRCAVLQRDRTFARRVFGFCVLSLVVIRRFNLKATNFLQNIFRLDGFDVSVAFEIFGVKGEKRLNAVCLHRRDDFRVVNFYARNRIIND